MSCFSNEASEPETQAVMSYVESIFPEDQRKQFPEDENALLDAYNEVTEGIFLDIHSFSESECKATGKSGQFHARRLISSASRSSYRGSSLNSSYLALGLGRNRLPKRCRSGSNRTQVFVFQRVRPCRAGKT